MVGKMAVKGDIGEWGSQGLTMIKYVIVNCNYLWDIISIKKSNVMTHKYKAYSKAQSHQYMVGKMAVKGVIGEWGSSGFNAGGVGYTPISQKIIKLKLHGTKTIIKTNKKW